MKITGGIAGNVIPDRCEIEVNYRFAPDKSIDQAEAYVREVLDGFPLRVTDVAAGARPGLDQPAAAEFLASVGGEASAKFGWTDVARFSAMGMPAVNFGPGDPSKAHADDEFCPADEVADLPRRAGPLALLTRRSRVAVWWIRRWTAGGSRVRWSAASAPQRTSTTDQRLLDGPWSDRLGAHRSRGG